jgi:hypothetical protein
MLRLLAAALITRAGKRKTAARSSGFFGVIAPEARAYAAPEPEREAASRQACSSGGVAIAMH